MTSDELLGIALVTIAFAVALTAAWTLEPHRRRRTRYVPRHRRT